MATLMVMDFSCDGGRCPGLSRRMKEHDSSEEWCRVGPMKADDTATLALLRRSRRRQSASELAPPKRRPGNDTFIATWRFPDATYFPSSLHRCPFSGRLSNGFRSAGSQCVIHRVYPQKPWIKRVILHCMDRSAAIRKRTSATRFFLSRSPDILASHAISGDIP
jgi:hypothetical protein